MSPLLRLQTLVLICILGTLMTLRVTDGLTRQRGNKQANRQDKPHMETVKLLLDPSVLMTSDPVPQLANYSLSPWTYSTMHDPSQFPSDIAQAKCMLIGCRNLEGKEVMDVESRPILQQVLVLRRVQGDAQSYFYKLESKIITVGCTCVRPNTVQQK